MLHGFVNSNDCKPKKVFPFKPASLMLMDTSMAARARARPASVGAPQGQGRGPPPLAGERASCSWAPLCHVIF